MTIGRRNVLLGLGAGLAAACAPRPRTGRTRDGARIAVPKVFPPFELQAGRAALEALGAGLTGFAVESAGRSILLVWLRDRGGRIWAVGVEQRALQFKFDVFALALASVERLQGNVAAWRPPPLPEGFPEELRRLLSTRPPIPTPPPRFEPWPFRVWTTDVLRRAEYIVEDVEVGPTFGSNPNAQGAARPGEVPPEAAASCDVAAGLLFSAEGGERLLIGTDWMPLNMVATQDPAEIDDYLATCEAVALADYARRLPAGD